MILMNEQDAEIFERIKTDQKLRIELCRNSHYWFFHVYFAEYIKYDTAPLHKEIIQLTEDEDLNLAVIAAFRGSAKSTIVSLSYPIWSILGKQQKKFVLISSQTERQAQLFLQNIKKHLETNKLLISDFGPLFENADEWQKGALVLDNYDARIMAFSVGNSLRGIRHKQTRPDLVIIDDVEDTQSVRTQEMRDKTSNWFKSEIIPAGQEGTKIMVVGNYLHQDSLIARLKESIQADTTDGIYREYPIYDPDENILWPGMYPNIDDIKKLERKINDPVTFHREYLLDILPTDDQVVHADWIRYYDQLPPMENVRKIVVSVDPAIGEEDTNDFTAIVTAYLTGQGEDTKIYLLPQSINRRMDFPLTCETIESLVDSFNKKSYIVLVENVGYQRAVIQRLEERLIRTQGVKVHGQDKRARLTTTTTFIKSGNILFPKEGAKVLIQQLVGFGTERHDDLTDAFSLMINHLSEGIRKKPPSSPYRRPRSTEGRPITAGLWGMRF